MRGLVLAAGRGARLAVVGGWRHRSLEAPGRIVFVNRQWADTTMVSSLLCAAEWLAEDETMVSYGDILFSRAAAAALSNVAAALAIAFDPEWQDLWSLRFEDPLSDAETFAVDDDGLVIDIVRRPSSRCAGSTWDFCASLPRAGRTFADVSIVFRRRPDSRST